MLRGEHLAVQNTALPILAIFFASSSALLSLASSSLFSLATLEGTASASSSSRTRFALVDFGLETGFAGWEAGFAVEAGAAFACLVPALVDRDDTGFATSVEGTTFLRGGMANLGREWEWNGGFK
jgi:hypothetical protein